MYFSLFLVNGAIFPERCIAFTASKPLNSDATMPFASKWSSLVPEHSCSSRWSTASFSGPLRRAHPWSRRALLRLISGPCGWALQHPPTGPTWEMGFGSERITRSKRYSNRKRDFDAIKLTLFKNLKSGYVNECKIKRIMATRLFLWCRNASGKVFECMIEKYDGFHFSKFMLNFGSKFRRHYFPIMNSGVSPQKTLAIYLFIYQKWTLAPLSKSTA